MVKRIFSDKSVIIAEREKIRILSPLDRLFLLIFVISFAISIVLIQLLQMTENFGFISAIFISVPLAVVGLSFCVYNKKNYIFIILLFILLISFFLRIDIHRAAVMELTVTSVIGVMVLVSIFQKAIFYPILSSIEYLNIKTRLTLFDRLVSFLFSISGDLDSRNIEINYNLSRASIPWGEVWSTIKISFMAGLFIWIYVSMNPSWMAFDSFANVPVYLFTIMLYIPLIVMPFSIFMSMNVRISTRYKDFKIYDGVKATLFKMVVPIFAAFIYVFLAVNKNGIGEVLYFIVLSILFNLVINIMACLAFYKWFEGPVVNEVRSKWDTFRPVSMMMVVEDENPVVKEDVPDTPRRDLSDLGVMMFGDSME